MPETDPHDDASTPDAPAAQPDLLGGAATIRPPVPAQDPPPAGGSGRDGDGPQAGDGQARPGRDENQAGFLQDPDKRFQP